MHYLCKSMANSLCIPCRAVNQETDCTHCVLSEHFPTEKLPTFLVLFDHYGTLANLRRRLEDLNSTEERDRWISNSYRTEMMLRVSPGGCIEELDRCKEELEQYKRKFGPLSEVRRDIRDTTSVDTESCYLGLVNQGATCYLNSVVQCLYHVPYIRQVVHAIPIPQNDDVCTSIPSALQTLFYDLQFGDTSVPTTELTRSLGWDGRVQHDAHEFLRTLIERLEDKMKGTDVQRKIQELFHGIQYSCFDCVTVTYQNIEFEAFYEIQLVVKGCHDVYASFDKYVASEILEGDNGIRISGCDGLKDAVKKVRFVQFPRILLLHLMRFCFEGDTAVKVNDKYEYPLQLDLDDEKYMDALEEGSTRNLYKLYSVVAHVGSFEGGHYYAYIREAISDKWFKFDDEVVTEVNDLSVVLDGCYGGSQLGSAYMLMYIIPLTVHLNQSLMPRNCRLIRFTFHLNQISKCFGV